ncbi:MAG: hypothetical protein JSS98_06070 [Bacteroidetes bacterium]|nr:hypothetical protein [Bacteroidota bacterium]
MRKNGFLIAGIGFLLLGTLVYGRVFTDISNKSAIAFIVCGSVMILYYFLRKRNR